MTSGNLLESHINLFLQSCSAAPSSCNSTNYESVKIGPASFTYDLISQGILPKKRTKQLTYEEALEGTKGMGSS